MCLFVVGTGGISRFVVSDKMMMTVGRKGEKRTAGEANTTAC